MTDACFSLKNSFWKNFCKNNWCKRPTVIKQAFATPLSDTTELFQDLTALPQENRVRVFQNGTAVQPKEISSWLPQTKDTEFSEYISRIDKMRKRKDFTLIVNDIEKMDPRLFNRSREFLTGLYDQLGRPAGYPDMILFMADYGQSPLGLHKDSADVFCFVIEGRKRIRVWPFDVFFKQTGDTLVTPWGTFVLKEHDYSSELDRSIVLEGEPGDILYWPASYWHVGEGTPGKLVVSLHQGVFPSVTEIG